MSKDKDAVIKEFSTSNVLNSLQYQVYKLFGHGWGSYVFGDGAVKFPAWMKRQHPNKWVGMTRLVGNRSLVYNRNAMVSFYMLPFYLEYIEYRMKKVIDTPYVARTKHDN